MSARVARPIPVPLLALRTSAPRLTPSKAFTVAPPALPPAVPAVPERNGNSIPFDQQFVSSHCKDITGQQAAFLHPHVKSSTLCIPCFWNIHF